MYTYQKGDAGLNEKAAKIVRVLTLPPVLLIFTLLLLRRQYPTGHFEASVILLCVLPLLSYPIWRAIPKLYSGGAIGTEKNGSYLFCVRVYSRILILPYS